MDRDRTTKMLLLSVALLLTANLITMFLRNPAPAIAQGRTTPVKYEIISSSIAEAADRLNKESVTGWRVNTFHVTEEPTGSKYHFLLSK